MDERLVTFTIDGREVKGREGQTILEAADGAGIYIPRLCYHKDLTPHASCRVCTVIVNGRPQAACTQPIAEGIIVENETPENLNHRRNLIDMLFIEGNHFCMFCEKSGNCELQAMAYRFGIFVPKYPYEFAQHTLDATHPDILIDRNRCILCARCVQASTQLDGKNVFGFVGRGPEKELAVDAANGLQGTDVSVTDRAVGMCPVGALLAKRVGYKVPVGQRLYDHQPIGSEIEKNKEGS